MTHLSTALSARKLARRRAVCILNVRTSWFKMNSAHASRNIPSHKQLTMLCNSLSQEERLTTFWLRLLPDANAPFKKCMKLNVGWFCSSSNRHHCNLQATNRKPLLNWFSPYPGKGKSKWVPMSPIGFMKPINFSKRPSAATGGEAMEHASSFIGNIRSGVSRVR